MVMLVRYLGQRRRIRYLLILLVTWGFIVYNQLFRVKKIVTVGIVDGHIREAGETTVVLPDVVTKEMLQELLGDKMMSESGESESIRFGKEKRVSLQRMDKEEMVGRQAGTRIKVGTYELSRKEMATVHRLNIGTKAGVRGGHMDKRAVSQEMDTREIAGIQGEEERDDILEPGHMDDAYRFPSFIKENPPNGTGEYGEEVIIIPSRLTAKEKRKYDEGFRLNSFNQFASDRISVNRRLRDPRSPECRDIKHQSQLQASVIICFHDEAWSVLLRSLHSVVNRSPKHLLKEVILVDDASELEYLRGPLERYLTRLAGNVMIVRTPRREGLIRARLLGYRHATAPVLVFLDSHIECFPGWLEPLLDRVAANPFAVPFPTIESINANTLAVRPHTPRVVGSFSWINLTFRWMAVGKLHHGTAPIRSATMPGGLFAISREWFTRLGTYDGELDYWGGENIELSFKVWMCNGSVEILPCSHVGHIFRHNNPIKWPTSGSTRRNSARVAEVWMDGYKQYFYETLGSEKVDFGNVSVRHNLRRRLKCHDFDWYLRHVHPELYVPTDCQAVGEIRNKATGGCIDSMGRRSSYPVMATCSGQGGNQFWCMRNNGEVWNYYQKLYVSRGIVIFHTRKGTTWIFTKEGLLKAEGGKGCLAADRKELILRPCSGLQSQMWHLKHRH